MTSDTIGVVVGGSLTDGIQVRLHPGATAVLGEYVTAPADGGTTILGMITNVVLKAAESGPANWPPPLGDDAAAALVREVLLDTGVYTAVEVTPYLELHPDGSSARARRLPRHFAPAQRADQATVDRAFAVGDRAAVEVGSPLGMDDMRLAVDIEKLFERSVGVFGKSGTGKSVLTLQLLDAMVAYSRGCSSASDRIVALVFDMHDDYGHYMKFQGEGTGRRRSLKGLHPDHVEVYTVDPTRKADGRIVIGTEDIEVDDIEILRSVGDFTELAIEAARIAADRFGRHWIDLILEDEPSPAVLKSVWGAEPPEDATWSHVAQRLGIHAGTFGNLRRGLRSIVRRPFVEKGSGQFKGILDEVVRRLLAGTTVVIQFGREGRNLDSYMLVANMLSRRIWEAYREAVEQAAGNDAAAPNRLVIVIEEAHKFLDRAVSGQSIFGQIARELRKYNVTLFVIDQRPSQIDPEVLSQIGTKIALQLDSEADVEALVGGVVGRASLRQIIATLESQQQALIFGHAVPMPIVVRPMDLASDRRPGENLRLPPLRERLGLAEKPAGGLYG